MLIFPTRVAHAAIWIVALAHGQALAGSQLFEIPYKGPGQVAAIEASGLEVVARTKDHQLHVAADPQHRIFLSSFGATPRILATESQMPAIADLDANLGAYRTYGEMVAAVNALQSGFPSLVALSSIGTSIEGRTIWAIKVSDNVAVDESEAEVLIMGCHHARELMAVEMPLRFLEHLLANYGADAQVTQLVNEREIYFVPVVNPDGYVYVQNNHAVPWWQWWRKNRRNNGNGTFGVDLNRNYDYLWGYDNTGSSPSTNSNTYRGTAGFSEPETAAIRNLCAEREFVISVSYHSYGELFLYPWGYEYDYTTDHAIFRGIADRVTASNGYLGGNPAEGAIYRTNGDADDWGYGEATLKPRMYSFTPEVGTEADGGFGPSDALIGPYFDLLLPMNLQLVDLAGNPAQVLGPIAPTIESVYATPAAQLVLNWSGNLPVDPNPAVSYAIELVKNPAVLAQDDAEAAAPHWALAGGFALSTARADQGTHSYYSGTGNNVSATLGTAIPLAVTPQDNVFSCRLWYDTETDWDYAYVEVSEDQGLIWRPMAGSVTTASNPNDANRGNGITGASNGWVQATFPLAAYVGQEILLRVHYDTDGSVTGEGVYVDMLGPVTSFEARQTLATGIPGTSHAFLPGPPAIYSYRVRGQDAAGDWSDWSTPLVVDVGDATNVTVVPPAQNNLGANVPNPFNPRTTLPYTVGTRAAPGARHVQVLIFDASGKRVATLVDELQAPGQYRTTWTGAASDGSRVASGHYFAELRVDGARTHSRKLTLVQ